MACNETEERIRRLVAMRQLDDARALVDELERQGASAGRVAFYRAGILAKEGERNYPEAISLLIGAAQVRGESPDLYSMIHAELSRLAIQTNQRQALRRVRVLAEHLWFEHRNSPEVRRWRGHLLLNLANHSIRNGEYADALSLLDESLALLRQRPEDSRFAMGATLQRSWCLCSLGRLDEARAALEEAWAYDVSSDFAQGLLLGEARLAFAEGDYRKADHLIEETVAAASVHPEPDWPVIVEARLVGLRVAVEDGRDDCWRLGEELRVLASQHQFSYVFRLIKVILLPREQKEDKTIWDALQNSGS